MKYKHRCITHFQSLEKNTWLCPYLERRSNACDLQKNEDRKVGLVVWSGFLIQYVFKFSHVTYLLKLIKVNCLSSMSDALIKGM